MVHESIIFVNRNKRNTVTNISAPLRDTLWALLSFRGGGGLHCDFFIGQPYSTECSMHIRGTHSSILRVIKVHRIGKWASTAKLRTAGTPAKKVKRHHYCSRDPSTSRNASRKGKTPSLLQKGSQQKQGRQQKRYLSTVAGKAATSWIPATVGMPATAVLPDTDNMPAIAVEITTAIVISNRCNSSQSRNTLQHQQERVSNSSVEFTSTVTSNSERCLQQKDARKWRQRQQQK